MARSNSPGRARSQPLAVRILRAALDGEGATAWAVADVRRAVRIGLGGREFTLLFLWIRFWSNGGGACMAEIEAFVQGLQALSDDDALVLGFVVDELHNV